MAKQLNVDMNFRANTNQAQQAIQQLQTTIQKLGYGSAPKGVLAADFEKASAAARELSYHLNNAFNTNTGNLDLSKLNTSLKNSGTNLATLTANFKNAGSAGQEAFVALSKSIANADQPAITLNTTLSSLLTTLKNTAKWQISSSILHGFMGALSEAKGYVWDLNESLNNIRIVTGQNVDQMAKFADQANKAAKALSTTTTDYTNASLIYYQQGLNDEQVRSRTDVTIKLANAAGISAEQASERLTSIWNNFDDGSQSLEHYADVLVKLGAETASSSEEISQGMQKFAAVGQTVGLSYEYAAAALATVTATTRESADTVGTAFRTLFSRIEGLQLGKEQDDGTTLNKYSKALEKVGISIKDLSTGDMKSMNDILDELGAKWQTLSKDTQIALAETIGGVRQYTQLMALMNNYDFFKQNVASAQGADGALQQQADIYAESWEAARDRVKASAQAIYQDLIDDEFFIKLNNGFAILLSGIDKFIDGFGGLKSVILSVGAIVLGMISNKIGPALQKVVQDIQILTGGSGKVYSKMQADFSALTTQEINSGKYDQIQQAELEGSNALLLAKTKYGMVSDQLSAQEKMRAELAIQGLQLQAEKYKELQQACIDAEKAQTAADEKKAQAQEKVNKAIDKSVEKYQKAIDIQETAEKKLNEAKRNLAYKQGGITNSANNIKDGSLLNAQTAARQNGILTEQEIIDYAKTLNTSRRDVANRFIEARTKNDNLTLTSTFSGAITQSMQQVTNEADLSKAREQLQMLATTMEPILTKSKDLREAFNLALGAQDTTSYNMAFTSLRDQLNHVKLSANDTAAILKGLGVNTGSVDNWINALKAVEQAENNLKTAQENYQKEAGNLTKEQIDAIEQLKQAKQNVTNAIKEQQDAEQAVKDASSEQEKVDAEDRLKTATEAVTDAQNKLNEARQNVKDINVTEQQIKAEEELEQATKDTTEAIEHRAQVEEELRNTQNNMNESAKNLDLTHFVSGLQGITALASGLGQVAMVANSVKSVIATLSDDSATLGEIITAIFMSVSMIAPGVIGIIKNISTATSGLITNTLGQAAASALSSAGFDAEAAGITTLQAAKIALAVITGKNIDQTLLESFGIKSETAALLLQNNVLGSLDKQKIVDGILDSKSIVLKGLLKLASKKLEAATLDEAAAKFVDIIATEGLGAAIKALLGPIGWVIAIIGVLITTLGVVFNQIKKNQEQQEENRKKLNESITNTKELVDANKELISSYDTLLDQYRDLKNSGEDYADTLDQLRQKALELSEVYNGIDGANLLMLSDNVEDYEKFFDKVQEKREKEIADAYNEANSALEANTTKFVDAMLDDNGRKAYGGAYSARFGIGMFNGANDKAAMASFERTNANTEGGLKYLSTGRDGKVLKLNVDNRNDPRQMVAAYEEAEAVYNDMLVNMTEKERNRSEIFSYLQNYLAKSAEAYQDIKANLNTIDQYQIEGEVYNYGIWADKSIYDISSIEEYGEYRKKLIDNLKEERNITDETSEAYRELVAQVDAYLGSISSLSEFKKYNSALEDWIKLYNSNKTETNKINRSVFIEKFKEYGLFEDGKLNNEDLEIALSINPYLNEKLLDNEIRLAKIKAKDADIELEIEAVIKGKELSSDKKTTSQDWADWASNSNIDFTKDFWAKSGITSFADFLILTDDEKTKILNEYQDLVDQEKIISEKARKEELEDENKILEPEYKNNLTGQDQAEQDVRNFTAAQNINRLAEDSGLNLSNLNSIKQLKENNSRRYQQNADVYDEALRWYGSMSDDFNMLDYYGNKANTDSALSNAEQDLEQHTAQVEKYKSNLQELEEINNSLTAESTTGWLDKFKAELEGTDFEYDEIAEYAKYLKESASETEELADSLENLDSKSLLDLALKIKMCQQGIKDLSSNFDSYTDVLKGTNKGTEDYSKQLTNIRKDISKIVDMDMSNVSGEWFEEQSDLIEKAAEGDREAISDLRAEAGKEIAIKIDTSDIEVINDVISEAQSIIDAAGPIEIGTSIGDIEGMDVWLASLNDMLTTGQLTIDQINAILSGIEMNPSVQYKEIKVTSDMLANANATQTVTASDGTQVTISSQALQGASEGATISVPVINSSATTYSGRGGGGGSTKSSGGGGGGGGSKAATKKDSRYKNIDARIASSKTNLDTISKYTDRAFGNDKISSYNEQLKETNNQLNLLKQKLQEAQNYLQLDTSAVQGLGVNPLFDADGTLLNYEEMADAIFDKYGSDSESYDDAMEKLDQLAETAELISDLKVEIDDTELEYLDTQLEALDYKVEVGLELNEHDLAVIEYYLNKIEDDAFAAAERLALFGQQAENAIEKSNITSTGLAELLDYVKNFGDTGKLSYEEIVDQAYEYRDGLIEVNETLLEISKTVEEELMNSYDAWNEKIDEQYDKFDKYASLIEHYQNIIDIVGRDNLGISNETLKLLRDTQITDAITKLASSTAHVDTLQATRANILEQLSKDLAEEDRRYWEEQLEQIDQSILDYKDQWMQDWEDALQGAMDAFSAAVEDAARDFEKVVSPLLGSIEELRDNFDRAKEIDDLYIDDYEKIYELNKLNRDITKSMDETDNIKAKKELVKLQEEINKKQADGVQLTKHDIEEMRKRYELKLAEAALDEAKEAKKTVRLVRNDEGNYDYIYTADEQAVADAEQNYEDKLFEYQQLNAEYIQELQDLLIGVEEEITQRIQDLDLTKYASKQEYIDAVNAIIEDARIKESVYFSELDETLQNQAILYEEDWQAYSDATGYRISSNQAWLDNWQETALAMQTGYAAIQDYQVALNAALGSPEDVENGNENTLLGNLASAYDNWLDVNERVFEAAGSAMDTFNVTVQIDTGEIEKSIADTGAAADTLSEKMKEEMSSVIDYISTWKTEYANAIKEIIEQNEALFATCEKLIDKLLETHSVTLAIEAMEESEITNPSEGDGSEGGSGSGGASNSSGSSSGCGGCTWNCEFGCINSCARGCSNDCETGCTYSCQSECIGGCSGKCVYSCSGGSVSVAGKTIQQFKTGGYTGAWVSARTGMYTGSWDGPDIEPNGKLAFLHQKELVLNADDTENILTAVDIIRQIDSLSKSWGCGFDLRSPSASSSTSGEIKQDIVINADFPAVQSHFEIEQAFQNLIGKASQYAGRK